MPTSITDASIWSALVAPIGADIRNAAAVRWYLQPLANRLKFLYDRSTTLASIAALKAISAPADGLVRSVRSKGVYVFDGASVASEVLPFVVQPDVGDGRWIHELYLSQGVANGLAKLDGSQQLVVHGASGFPTFETPRSLIRRAPAVPLFYPSGWAGAGDAVTGPGSDAESIRFPLRLHDGATLASVEAVVSIRNHVSLPTVFPKLRVTRTQTTAGAPHTMVDLRSASPTVWVEFPTPVDVAAYVNSNVIQKWTYTCTQNNVINAAQYTYHAVLVDEDDGGALAGNSFYGFVLNYAAIPDTRFP